MGTLVNLDNAILPPSKSLRSRDAHQAALCCDIWSNQAKLELHITKNEISSFFLLYLPTKIYIFLTFKISCWKGRSSRYLQTGVAGGRYFIPLPLLVHLGFLSCLSVGSWQWMRFPFPTSVDLLWWIKWSGFSNKQGILTVHCRRIRGQKYREVSFQLSGSGAVLRLYQSAVLVRYNDLYFN